MVQGLNLTARHDNNYSQMYCYKLNILIVCNQNAGGSTFVWSANSSFRSRLSWRWLRIYVVLAKVLSKSYLELDYGLSSDTRRAQHHNKFQEGRRVLAAHGLTLTAQNDNNYSHMYCCSLNVG